MLNGGFLVATFAALFVGEWTTAMVVVFFMHIGNYTENLTTEGARRAVKDLTAMAPQTARVENNGEERDTPIADVHIADIVVVRPGEKKSPWTVKSLRGKVQWINRQ